VTEETKLQTDRQTTARRAPPLPVLFAPPALREHVHAGAQRSDSGAAATLVVVAAGKSPEDQHFSVRSLSLGYGEGGGKLTVAPASDAAVPGDVGLSEASTSTCVPTWTRSGCGAFGRWMPQLVVPILFQYSKFQDSWCYLLNCFRLEKKNNLD
jgi:hypothetical protein